MALPPLRLIDARSQDPFVVLKSRAIHRDAETQRVVGEIIEDVRSRGDQAVLDSARRFDAPDLASFVVSEAEIGEARIEPKHEQAIRTAIERVRAFHLAQIEVLTSGMEGEGRAHRWMRSGFGQRLSPVQRAGVYVPGGLAAYPSSVVMNAVPALCAGVASVAVTTPASKDGTLPLPVLVALREVGVTQAYKIGGAAAVAALALGTESIPRVDVVAGPGNRFVNEAKRQLWGTVGLDGYAGPSEVCALIDGTSNARFAAADLLTQIEHAPDNAGFLVSTDEAKLGEVLAEIELQIENAPRAETMRKALAGDSLAFLARDLEQACEIVNAIAPEHLSIATAEPESAMDQIHSAGCVLLGEWSPESAGDFAAGPSHTLPTSGAARYGSPLNVLHFLKVQSIVNLRNDQLAGLRPVIEAFGEMEGFPAHSLGATVRFEQ